MKNVGKICGIPMSSLGDVHLISGIANCQFDSRKHCNLPPAFIFSIVLQLTDGAGGQSSCPVRLSAHRRQ